MKRIIFSAAILSAAWAAAQNTGIGTTNPTEKLEVVGNIKSSSLSGTGDRVVVADATGVLKTSSLPLSQTTSKWFNDVDNQVVKLNNLSDGDTARTGESMFNIYDNGAVTIGHSLNSNFALSTTKIDVLSSGATQDQRFFMTQGATGIFQYVDAANGGQLVLSKYRGRYGSTLNPVQIGDKIGEIHFRVGDHTGSQGSTAMNGVRMQAFVSRFASVTDFDTKLYIYTRNSANSDFANNVFSFAETGNFGIGTFNPAEKLDVAGNIRSGTINNNAGSTNDKVVVTDANGVLKSVDRSGFASPYTAGSGINISNNIISSTGLERITINSKTGWKLINVTKPNLGQQAVDLSSNFGQATGASGNQSFAAGVGTQASGSWSTALGASSYAESQFETSIGGNGTRDATPEPTQFTILSKRLFNIGNSFNSTLKSDAFTVLRNAKVGIGYSNFETNTSDAKLNINGTIKIGNNGITDANGNYQFGTIMPCNSNNEGALRYVKSSSVGVFQGCRDNNGTYEWVNLNL